MDAFKKYASSNPGKLFVQKNKGHRGIRIEPVERLDLRDAGDGGSFIQEFVDDPLLIDGYKFDVGVYTMVTSVDPLRIYVFEGGWWVGEGSAGLPPRRGWAGRVAIHSILDA